MPTRGTVYNILGVYSRADPLDLVEGHAAYEMYHRTMRHFADEYLTSVERVAGIFAALSPMNDYRGNLRSMKTVLDAIRECRPVDDVTVTTTHPNRDKAWQIANHVEPTTVLRSSKVRSFYDNIAHPTTSVEVDDRPARHERLARRPAARPEGAALRDRRPGLPGRGHPPGRPTEPAPGDDAVRLEADQRHRLRSPDRPVSAGQPVEEHHHPEGGSIVPVEKFDRSALRKVARDFENPGEKKRRRMDECATRFCRGTTHRTHRKKDGSYSYNRHCGKCLSRREKERNPLRYFFRRLRNRARERGHEFTLAFEEWTRFCTEHDLLARRGKTATSLSVDRKKSSLGYSYDNIQPMTLSENGAKGAADDPDDNIPF
jgi:hypothetical protein